MTPTYQMIYSENSSEAQVIEGCIRQDRKAQKELYKRYYTYVVKVCIGYTSNMEENAEVVNDVFFKIFKDLKQYKGSGSLAGWMRKIALRTAIDYVRKNTRYKASIDIDVQYDLSIQNEALENISTKEILTSIQKIPAASRNVFSLHVIEGYTHKEIAQMLSISINTSKWHLSNTRKELQKIIIKNNSYLIAL